MKNQFINVQCALCMGLSQGFFKKKKIIIHCTTEFSTQIHVFGSQKRTELKKKKRDLLLPFLTQDNSVLLFSFR